MIQECQIYFNIFCNEEDKAEISNWLTNYFNDKKNRNVFQQPITNLEIVDDAKTLIVLDITVENKCYYIGGYPGSRWEPPEPAYIQDYFDSQDFEDWIKDILINCPLRDFMDIEIDNDSFIPSEDFLIREFENKAVEDYYNEKY